MNEAIKKIDDINVADEFLSDDEEKIEDIRIVDSEIERQNEEESSPADLFVEEYLDESDNSDNVEKDQIETISETTEFHEEIEKPIEIEEKYNVIHNQVFSNVANNDYNDEILEKIKNHHNELTLLIDALERQVLDNKKIISDQKFYISKMEKDVKETTIQDEELKKSLAVTINKLKKAEKKLEIVKRELLD